MKLKTIAKSLIALSTAFVLGATLLQALKLLKAQRLQAVNLKPLKLLPLVLMQIYGDILPSLNKLKKQVLKSKYKKLTVACH